MKADVIEHFYSSKERAYFSHARSEIFPLLPRNFSKIFEIGCGGGATLRALQQHHALSFVGGIDIDRQSIEDLRPHIDLALLGNIEQMQLPKEVNNIDVMLCLDILEHLVDPWSVVKQLHGRLSKNGVIIASIPNVRYLRTSLPLLLEGKWELEDAGILDRSHLRFFVKDTAIQLMTCSGLQLQHVEPTGLERGRKARLLNLLTLGAFENLMAYQYLIRVGRISDSKHP
jgi:2-polyprenyl-3-methyl-5-hydroxy-6-metoxy-1,4-benzoquinol methylase